MQTTEQIIENLKASIEADIRQKILTSLTADLGSPAAEVAVKAKPSAKAAPAAKTKPAKSKPGAKRTPEEIGKTMSDVRSFVKVHPGSNAEAIKKHLGVELNVITLPIQKLLKTRTITSKGEKRATRYYPGKGA